VKGHTCQSYAAESAQIYYSNYAIIYYNYTIIIIIIILLYYYIIIIIQLYYDNVGRHFDVILSTRHAILLANVDCRSLSGCVWRDSQRHVK